MRLLVATVLLMAFAAVGEKHETHKFVVLYMNDEGRVPYLAYPEGGGPHYSRMHGKWFDTRADAVTWLNQNTAITGPFSRVFASGEGDNFSAKDVIGIFAVTEVPVKFAETGKTYETYEQEPKKVVKPVKEWQ